MQITQLSDEQLEKICEIAEEAARKHAESKVPRREIADLTVAVDLEGTDALKLNIEAEVTLSSNLKGINVEALAKDSVKAAFEATEKYLRENGCLQEK